MLSDGVAALALAALISTVAIAQEASWREDNRRVDNGAHVSRVPGLAMKRKPSVDFSGYWQRQSTRPAPAGMPNGRSCLNSYEND
jgi:hypothetical protein